MVIPTDTPRPNAGRFWPPRQWLLKWHFPPQARAPLSLFFPGILRGEHRAVQDQGLESCKWSPQRRHQREDQAVHSKWRTADCRFPVAPRAQPPFGIPPVSACSLNLPLQVLRQWPGTDAISCSSWYSHERLNACIPRPPLRLQSRLQGWRECRYLFLLTRQWLWQRWISGACSRKGWCPIVSGWGLFSWRWRFPPVHTPDRSRLFSVHGLSAAHRLVNPQPLIPEVIEVCRFQNGLFFSL